MTFAGDGASPLEEFLWDFDRLTPAVQGLPRGFRCDAVFASDVPGGLELIYLTGKGPPRADDLRRVWRDRSAKRAVAVLAVAAYPTTEGVRADLVGLHDDRPHRPGVDLAEVERAAAAALEAGSRLEAERLLRPLFDREEETGLPRGLRNEGLFAAWELTEHVPSRSDWVRAGQRAAVLRGRRGIDLLSALGWKASPLGSTGHLIGDGQQDRAVAVLLQDDELFERRSGRLGDVSPVERGLGLAHKHRVPWVVAVQGDLVRLYAASADVGVGRKGASSTYAELHLSVLDDGHLAYAPLLLSPGALAPGGSVEQILESSADHAASLGARLRDRVYQDAVPQLAETVADRLEARSEAELAQAYHVTLVILFRLLFVAYAEDRALLPYKRNTVYTRVALKTRARQYTDQQREHGKVEHSDVAFDVWNDLTDIWRAVDEGHSEWGVPAYSGGLFSDDDDERGRVIAGLRLTNAEIGPALVAMLVDTGKDGTFGPVDFQALSVREFGTIYEGLLESSLSLAPVALTLDERSSYVPAGPRDTIYVRAGQVYFHNASGARKATGSYFTKQFAVEHLLTTALDPAVDEHLARVRALLDAGDSASAGEAFFDLRVADIAMGSGHFLIGAVDHVALRMSAFLADHPVVDVDAELGRLRETAVQRLHDVGVTELPEIDPANLLRRQVARRCIYGVDINQIAVDLARLALWIHTFVPGLPMSSLEHGLVQGNALTGIGTLDEAFEVLSTTPKASRGVTAVAGQIAFGEEEVRSALTASRDLLVQVKRTAEATAAEVAEAAAAYRAALAAAAPARELLDAAVAGRLGLLNLPASTIHGPAAVRAEARAIEVQDRLAELHVLHFPVAFPEVFLRDRPGFDVILGNPPWEELQVEELKFWNREIEGLKGKSPQVQKRLVEELRHQRPALYEQFQRERAAAEAMRPVLLVGPFPGLGTGDLDLYRVFCWRSWQVVSSSGRVGTVLPRTAFNSEGSRAWRSAVTRSGAFERVDFLTNDRNWVFDGVDPRYTVALSVVTRAPASNVAFAGSFRSMQLFLQGADDVTRVSVAEFQTWSSNLGFPLLPSAESGRVFRRLRSHPRFDAWGDYRAVAEFHATNDRSTFDAGERMPTSIPVYTGRSFDLWTPDTGQYYAWADPARVEAALQAKRLNQHRNKRTAFYGLPTAWVSDAATLPMHRARIAFRDIARATDSRTVIAALLPPEVVITNKAPWLFSAHQDAQRDAYLLGVLSSIPLDWYARRWVELSLNIHILNGLPIPLFGDGLLHRRLVEVSARLAAVDERYAAWAAEVGVPVGSVTDPAQKADLIAEVDALVGLLYGLERGDVEHIFATFHRGWAHHERLAAVLAHHDRWATA